MKGKDIFKGRTSLGEASGLGESSPIYNHLVIVDERLDRMGYKSWAQIWKYVPMNDLLTAALVYMGHPIHLRWTSGKRVKKLIHWLIKKGEPDLAKLVCDIRGQGIGPDAVRRVVLYIFCNLELLRDREQGKNRSIDDVWMGPW